MDFHEALRDADLIREEVGRRIGARTLASDDVVRQRLRAFLDPPPAPEDPAEETNAQDARRCGALIVRLGGAATATAVAAWMGWTMERTAAALAELDDRLDACGLRVIADGSGCLSVGERARLRARPKRLPFELAERLGADEHAHALAHLVRSDRCSDGEAWMQPLLDLGAAVPHSHLEVAPSEVIAAAFAGAHRRALRLPHVVEIRESGDRRPPLELWGDL